MLRRTIVAAALGGAALSLLPIGEANAQAACPQRLGGVLSLTGSMAAIGKAIADTAVLAVEHINQAGGVHGCPIEFRLRDDQNAPQVGVDAAKSLVDVDRVPAIIGAIGSGITLPILTSVAVPAKVTVVSCCSTSPTFTRLAEEGQSQGYYFRTLPTTIVQAITSSRIALDRGWKNVAVLYVNTDFGVNMAKDFQRALEKFGGKVTASLAFNENQSSYRPEVNRAMAAGGDAMFLIGFPGDSATLMREWISLGGTQNLILNNALRSDEFIRNVGARFLGNAWGMDNAQTAGPSVDQFNKDFRAKFNRDPNGPGLHTIYDAVAVTALAMASSQPVTGTSIRDNIRRVTGGDGVEVLPGVEGLKKGFELLKQGQRIRYVGATGPVEFDKNGDVAGAALIWRIKDGQLTNEQTITVQQMNGFLRQLAN